MEEKEQRLIDAAGMLFKFVNTAEEFMGPKPPNVFQSPLWWTFYSRMTAFMRVLMLKLSNSRRFLEVRSWCCLFHVFFTHDDFILFLVRPWFGWFNRIFCLLVCLPCIICFCACATDKIVGEDQALKEYARIFFQLSTLCSFLKEIHTRMESICLTWSHIFSLYGNFSSF